MTKDRKSRNKSRQLTFLPFWSADISEDNGTEFVVTADTECARMNARRQIVALDTNNGTRRRKEEEGGGETDNENNDVLCLEFSSKGDANRFRSMVDEVKSRRTNSVFSRRTEEASANQYFQFYGYLSQQQNMMQDFVRTSTYQKAIHSNMGDFHNKVVLDVGAGSGILSFFAVQAGAKLVYAVEASNMAQYAEQLVQANNLSDKIVVIAGKIEVKLIKFTFTRAGQ